MQLCTLVGANLRVNTVNTVAVKLNDSELCPCSLQQCWAFCGTKKRGLVDFTMLRGPAGAAHCKLPVKHKTSQTECSQMTTFKVALSMCNQLW